MVASSVPDLDREIFAGLHCNDCGKAAEPEEWNGRHLWVANEKIVVSFASATTILSSFNSF